MGVQKNFIGGEWIDSAAARDNVNPSDLSDVVGTYAQADAAAVGRAVGRFEQQGDLTARRCCADFFEPRHRVA